MKDNSHEMQISEEPLDNSPKILHIVLSGCIVAIFWGNFIYFNLIHQFTWTDVEYYADFISHFPILYSNSTYGHYPVLYLPHFAFISFPLYFLSEFWGYLIMTVLNFYFLSQILHLSSKMPEIYNYSIKFILLIMTSTLARWGNMEIIVFFFSLFVLLHAIEKHTVSQKMIFVFALFCFKLLNLVVVPLILLELRDKRERIKFLLMTCLWLGILQVPYIFLNLILDPSFIQSILSIAHEIILNRHPALNNVFVLILRPSFSWPIVAICLRIFSEIGLKIKKRRKQVQTEENQTITVE